jgi:hypothetical protein
LSALQPEFSQAAVREQLLMMHEEQKACDQDGREEWQVVGMLNFRHVSSKNLKGG